MNSNTDISNNNVDITVDSSNNEPPKHHGITDSQDIDIDISLNSNSTGTNDSIYNNTIKDYAFKSDIENGLNDMPFSLKVRTSNLASSTVKYTSYP